MKYLSLSVNGTPIEAPGNIPDGTEYDVVNRVIQWGIGLLMLLAVLFALYVIIRSGIAWIMAEGDKTKVQAARSRLIYAIVGLVLILGSFFVITFVGSLFDIKLIGL